MERNNPTGRVARLCKPNLQNIRPDLSPEARATSKGIIRALTGHLVPWEQYRAQAEHAAYRHEAAYKVGYAMMAEGASMFILHDCFMFDTQEAAAEFIRRLDLELSICDFEAWQANS